MSIFVENGYEYNLDTKNIDIITDISWIIKFYDYRIKNIIK